MIGTCLISMPIIIQGMATGQLIKDLTNSEDFSKQWIFKEKMCRQQCQF